MQRVTKLCLSIIAANIVVTFVLSSAGQTAEISCWNGKNKIIAPELNDSKAASTLRGWCSSTISVVGEIKKGDARRFELFIEGLHHVDKVDLNSPGGDLREGLELGRVFRKRLLSANVLHIR